MYGGGTFGRTGGGVPRTGGAYVAGPVEIAGTLKTTGRIWTTTLGAAAAPAIAIGILGNEGMYSPAAGQLGIPTAGAARAVLYSGALDLYSPLNMQANVDVYMGAGGQIFADYGSAAAPGYSFNGRPADGFHSPAGVYINMGTATLLGATVSVSDIYMASTMRYQERVAGAPAAAADYATIYAIDVAGKTQWNFLAPTGVAQQIKIES